MATASASPVLKTLLLFIDDLLSGIDCLFYPIRRAQPAPLLAQHDRVRRIARIVLDARWTDGAPAVRRQQRLQARQILAGRIFNAGDVIRVENHLLAELQQIGIAHLAARMQRDSPPALQFSRAWPALDIPVRTP